MQVAFYKSTRSGLTGIYNKLIRCIDKGLYSHVEIVFSDGTCASASFMDKGVRFKQIFLDPTKWDVLDISWANETEARKWFENNEGKPYDLLGNIRFLFGFVGHSESSSFCSEAVAEAIGFKDGWRLSPNGLYDMIVLINKQVK